VVIIGRHSVHDVQTMLICVITAVALWRWRIPEPLVVAAAGLTGLLLFGLPGVR
jgi:chromate transporter